MMSQILMARRLFVVLLLLHPCFLLAQDLPGILMDLAPGYDRTPSSNPSNFTRSGQYVYFTARENPNSSSDTRLWRTDGTLAGTHMVARSKNLVKPTLLTDVNGTLAFSCNGLWKTDGTDVGTIKLSNVQPTEMAAVGSQLAILVAKENALELWKSNGTVSGTSRSFSMPTAGTPQLRNVKGISKKLYFVMTDGAGTERAWCSDGTAKGTVLLSNVTTTYETFTEFAGQVYFGALQGQLLKTNGTAAGTRLLKTFAYTGTGTNMSLAEFGGYLYIGAYDGLYKTDGTEAGTVPAITFESATPFPRYLTAFGDMLVFTATPQSRRCLMRTDGSQAGTSVISDFGFDSYVTYSRFTASTNHVYFTGTYVFNHDSWVIVTDGTADGTSVLTGMSGTGALLGDVMVGRGGAYGISMGSEPWITDATVPGTQLLKDICKSPEGVWGYLNSAAQAVFCEALPLWSSSAQFVRTKGTKATTDRISGTASFYEDADLGSQILFSGSGDRDNGLYRLSAEGPAVVQLVKNFRSGTKPRGFITSNNHAWFRADDGVHGWELWKSDGTENGTQMVKDIYPGSGSGVGANLIVKMNGTVYFLGNDGVNGYDLWKSDGTENGTQTVKNLPNSSGIQHLVVAGNKIFFEQSPNLYVSDGTAEGTSIIKTYADSSFYYMRAFKDLLFFAEEKSGPLYFSDGTPSGTQAFGNFGSIAGLAVLDDKLLFCGVNDLFVSDGTVSGTRFLKGVAFKSYCAVANGIFYFAYDDTEHGREIWQTDGTPEGTHLAFDIYPGPIGSFPTNLASSQGKLYFNAEDPFCGREIFVYPMEGLRESVTSYFDQGDTAARKIGNTSCTLDFVTHVEGGEVRVNAYTIDPPRYRGKALKKHWEILGLYDQDFSVHLSFGYTPNELIAAGVTEEELRLLKSEDEGLTWTEVPSDILADVNRVKTRHPQTSLSLWAIAGSKAAVSPGIWQAYER